MSNDNPARMKVSIIIPTLNEAGCIDECLGALQELRRRGHEVIVVDGGSTDATPAMAAPDCDQLIISARGRARQMNVGAAAASGGILVFLHADTRFDCDPDAVLRGYTGADSWGRFDISLSGRQLLFRLLEFSINLRSRLSGIATGDQAIFISRRLFIRVGGYPEIPLMEDVAMSRILKRIRRPDCLNHKVITSSRRWEKHGILRTVLKMWSLRFRYAMGADPAILAGEYD